MPAVLRVLLPVSSLILFAALALILSSSFGPSHVNDDPIASSSSSSSFSSSSFGQGSDRSPTRNVWAELEETEVEAVYKFLYEQPNRLNLTRKPHLVTGWENSITLVETLQPNKTDVLPYLNGTGSLPSRWARVVVAQGSTLQALVAAYMVGPLPPTNDTEIIPLTYPYNSGRNYVRNPVPDFAALSQYGNELSENISDITQDLLGSTFGNANLSDPTGIGLSLASRAARIDEDGGMIIWMQVYRTGALPHPDTLFLLPQGLYFKLSVSSRDPTKWRTSQWVYNGILYESLASFRAAWEQPDFVKVGTNLDGNWTSMEDYESAPPGRSKPPPITIQPYGPRYFLSKKDAYISYLGWSFYVSTSASTGLGLFDIRFQGSRILYSLGLQEALAHYAGSDPFQGGLEFLDSFFGFGVFMYELVPGYDCPAYADFLPLTYHRDGKTFTTKNAICIFEYTADGPLSRHTSPSYTTVSKNTYLVVRTVSTVGNYDYTIEYLFYLDGTLEVKVRASGFIFAAFYPQPLNSTARPTPQQHEYGYRIHDAIASSMHDHVINFRADFDIDGTANSFVRVGIEPHTAQYGWDVPEFPAGRQTMHLTHTPVTHETGLHWPHNGGEMYIVLSSDNNNDTNSGRNTWGEQRGYRITPGTGTGTPAHLTIRNSTSLGKSASWATADLWLLRQHDDEPRTASELNWLAPTDPLVDFAKMVDDGEPLVEQDLVVVFNLGGHHVPVAGDLPNTMMHTSASSVMFVPHNLGARDLSRGAVSGVRVDGGGPAGVRYFGGRYEQGVRLGREELEPELGGYGGGDGDGDGDDNGDNEGGERGRVAVAGGLSLEGIVLGFRGL